MEDEKTAKADLISALQNTAMLCGLRTRALGLSRTHRGASIEVTSKHGATLDAATVRVNRLAGADAQHRKIVGLQGQMRKVYEAHTLPWDAAGGWRMLPNASFMKLAQLMAPMQKEIQACLDDYRKNAADILAQAAKNLGDLASEIQLPTLEELTNAYETRLEFGTIPDTAALKNLPSALTEKLAVHMQNRAKAAYDAAIADVQERTVKPLQHLIARLNEYDERESRDKVEGERDLKGVFRDTTVTNITELAKTLPGLNVLGDAHVEEIVGGVVNLAASINPESLRASREQRDSARARAASILAQMGL